MKAFLYSFSSIVTVSGLLKFIVQEQQHKMSINERMKHIFFIFKPPFLISLYHNFVNISTALPKRAAGLHAMLANEGYVVTLVFSKLPIGINQISFFVHIPRVCKQIK